ncbi:MAG TPA: DNA adenine methylase [Thermoplasmata archaeon]|nr:DNA adenine methylase [Thermoplasmata archaeon]
MPILPQRKATPFVKWAGGKAQLLRQLDRFFPTEYETYFEPFLGGGAVFFHIRPERAVLADTNPELINAFKVVRDDPRALMAALDSHFLQRTEESHFYRVREQHPSDLTKVERASRTIFLNKTCFNGLYRVNSQGIFNVPWGGYKNPTLYDRENILAASAALRGKRILVADYRKACAGAVAGDFVYLDPPYHPLSETSRFTSYTKKEFGSREQRDLSEECKRLDSCSATFMLSNSSTELVRSLYAGFHVETLKAKRAINSVGSRRGAIDELLVMNYP